MNGKIRTTDSSEHGFSGEEALWLAGSLCAIHQINFDPSLFAQRYPPPFPFDSFVEGLSELGLCIERHSGSLKAVLARSLPSAVVLRRDLAKANDDLPHDGVDSTKDGSGNKEGDTWALLLHADESNVVVLEPGASSPVTLPIKQLEARYRGCSLAVRQSAARMSDPDSLDLRKARFGLRWFLPELLKYKAIWREVLLASLVLQLIGLGTPLFTQAIIDKVVVHRTQSTLIALGVGMAIFLVFTAVLTWIRQYLILHTGQRIDAVLGSHIFSHLLKLPLPYFQTRPTGVISARLQGIETIREFVSSAAVTLILDLPFLLIFVGIMFWYSVTLTLLVLAVLAVITTMSAFVAPVFRERLDEQFRRGAANQAFVTEYVAGLETVKSLQFEPQLNQRYRHLLGNFLSASMSTRLLGNSYNTAANALEQVLTLLVLLVGAWTVMNQPAFTIGMLVAFQMFASRVSQPMLRLVGLWQQWQQTQMSVARLGDIMNAPTEPYSLVPRRMPAKGPAAIQAEGISFRYDEKLPYLYQNLNLDIASGQVTVLMGPSGTGKSTLAKLLQGFYVTSTGRIKIDGIDISMMSANELRTTFGVVPQETVLFCGTVMDNLKLANPYASFEQIVAACRMAEVHTVIEGLPNGYQTEIGERGTGLSGGQRQRIAIARALLKGPRALIFDEATSSVDGATGEQLARTINGLRGRVTILFIAHQLPKSLQVDRVLKIGEKLNVVNSEVLQRTSATTAGHVEGAGA